jgi:hypothetical protein
MEAPSCSFLVFSDVLLIQLRTQSVLLHAPAIEHVRNKHALVIDMTYLR